MNVLEANRDAYLAQAGNKRRVALIVLGVILFHVVVIGLVARWRGWNPVVGEGLIRVSIVADKPAPATPPAHRLAAPQARPL